MANDFWNVDANGNWTTAADWSLSFVPGSGDDGILGVTGFSITEAYTVTINTSVTVGTLTITDAAAVLSVASPGMLTVGSDASNAGDIELQYAGTIDVTDDFVNTGLVDVDTDGGSDPSGDSALAIGGTLTNSANVNIGNGALAAEALVTAAALDNTGKINLSGNDTPGSGGQAVLDITAAAPAIWTGTVTLAGQSLVEFTGGSIGTIAQGAEIYLATSDGYIADAGTLTGNSALTGLTDIAGDLELQYGAAVTLAGNVSDAGSINVDTQSAYGDNPSGGSTLTISGTLTNSGALDLGNAFFGNGGLTASATVSVAALVNTGTINLTGNSAVGTGKQAVLEVGAAAPVIWTGSLSMSGQSLLEYASGSIGTIAQGAEIYLATSDGYIADAGTLTSNSALTGLTDIAGDFELQYGAAVTLAGDVDDTGSINVDTQSAYGDNPSGGSALTISGTLTNSGYVSIGNAFFGVGGLTATGTISAAGFVNTGNVTLTGNSTVGTGQAAVLDIAGAAPTVWNGSLSMSGQSLLEFGSGSIGTIAQGAQIYLATSDGYIADAGTLTADGALSGLNSIAGAINLEFGAVATIGDSVTDTGSISLDTTSNYGDNPSGGSSLAIAGTLTNAGNVNLGNAFFGGGGLTASDLLSAAALVNTGNITLTGNSAVGTGQATVIDIAGAAPTVWNGALTLTGQSLLEFGSGSIGTIAANSSINLLTSEGYIADAGALTANGALSGLTDVEGTLNLDYGAAVALTGDLTDDATIDLDTDNPAGGTSLAIAGTLTIAGALSIGDSGQGSDTTVSAAALDSTGSIALNGNGGAGDTQQAQLLIAAAAPQTWMGSLYLSGQALLEFGSGSIGTIAAGASIEIYTGGGFIADADAPSSNSALSGLSSVAGTFQIEFLGSVAVGGDLAVTGFLGVDDHIFDGFDQSGGSTLTIGGTLTVSSTLTIGNYELTGPTLVTAASLDNTGAITIQGNNAVGTTQQAALDIAGIAPMTWTGSLSVDGQALLQYASGSIITIAAGASINLDTVDGYIADADAPTSNSALTGLTGNAGSFYLEFGASVALSGDLANTGFLGVDEHIFDGFDQSGGSALAITGTLTNSGKVVIGNYALLAPTTISFGNLVNQAGASFTATGGGTYAVTLSVAGTIDNEGALSFGNNVFATAAGVTNSGTLGLYGSAGVPTTLSVNGTVGNTGTLTVGAYAELGVTGAIADSGTLFVGGVVDAAAGLEVQGTGSLVMQNGQIITPDAASLTIDAGGVVSGDGVLSLAVVNGGVVTAANGLLDIAAPITGSGALAIAQGAELELGGATAETVAFDDTIGTLKLDAPTDLAGAITGLVQGDVIDLAGVQATSAVLDGATLTVTAGSQVYTYQVSGPGLAGNNFALEDDQQGGTDLVLGPPGPTISGPNTLSAFLDYPTLFGPLTIADPSAGAGTLTVTLTAGTGTLQGTAANAGTLTGSGTSTLTLTGDLADINTMLAAVTYLGATAGVSDTVRVVVTDASSLTAADTVAVTTQTVPYTAPLLNQPDILALIGDIFSAFGGLSVSDPYAVVNGQTLTLESLFSGTLTASGGPGGMVTGLDTDDLSITGTVAQINSYLADAITGESQVPTAVLIQGVEQQTLQAGSRAALRQAVSQLSVKSTAVQKEAVLNALKYELYKDASFSAKVVNLYLNGPSSLYGLVAYVTKVVLFGWGNIQTSDGLIYPLNATGDFILAQSTQPGDSFQVQVRLQPIAGSAANTNMTALAALVGTDRINFTAGPSMTVTIDGAPGTVGPAAPTVLSGGTVTQAGANTYVVTWNTGEVLTVVNEGSYLDVGIQLPSSEAAGSVVGLEGPNGGGQANDFTLPDGTVLPQPLTTSELYSFAAAWQVPDGSSLFDAPAAPTGSVAPAAVITLADLPATIVALAAQAVAAAGITDPGLVAAAEYDFIASGGDPSLIAADADALQGGGRNPTTAASLTETSPAPIVLGVIAAVSAVQAAQSGPTTVTFDVYLTGALTTATEVDYAVLAAGATDLTAADFGGTLPSGDISIAAGQTFGTITIDVPQGALGTLPSADVALQISTPGGVPIFAADSVEAVSAAAVTAPSGTSQGGGGGGGQGGGATGFAAAAPELEYLGTLGTFSQAGNAYTLDLGDISLGQALPALQFGVVNAAASPGDSLTGAFAWPTVAGFAVSVDGNTASGASLVTPITPGSADTGLVVTTIQDKFGAQDETITFTPVDTNNSGYSTALAPITLTIADTLDIPGTIQSQAWGDVHIVTYNGLEYNFQSAGEFTLAESNLPDDDFDIQLRLQPYTESSSVTYITQVAISLGADEDVVFAATGNGAATDVLVNGGSTTLSMADPTLVLSGGTITEVSPTLFKVLWNTGESMTVTESTLGAGFPYFNVTDAIPGAAEGSIMGLQGEDEGTQNDFQLPDGTVLPQPLTTAELYGEYADAWRVSESQSLFYYFSGTSYETFAHPDFPLDPLSLSDLPASVVAQAAQLAAAAGITDPVTAQDAELDYIATGDPSVFNVALNVQQQVTGLTAPTVTESTPAAALGVMAEQTSVTEASSGPTAVTFTAYLTAAQTGATTVDYTVIDSNMGDIDAAAFGGVLPSGSVTIAAGQTMTPFTVDVPQGALGTAPDENLQVQISSPGSAVTVFAPTAQTAIVNPTPQAGSPALPVLTYLGSVGSFTFDAETNTYTLDLGGVTQGAAQQDLQFGVINSAAAPADSLGGSFTVPTGTGFTIAGNTLTVPLGPGGVYQGLYALVNTAQLGANGLTLTFDPVDENASGYSAPLTPITLDIVDSVTPAAQGVVNTPSTVIFPNVHVGGTDSQPISVSNTAAPGAADLDVTLSASGSATAAGTITQLAPGATDASDLMLGLDTGTAGALNGQVSETFTSDTSGAVTDPTIDVFGDVYRLATASIVPVAVTVREGASGSQSLVVTNSDPADGYSENLIATVIGTTGAVTASGTTGEIAAQQSGTLGVDFSTATSGQIGTVTLDLKSDGTGIDGLGTTDLGDVTIPVTVTVINPAVAQFVSSDATIVPGADPETYVINLGTIAQNSADPTISLATLNAAAAPADDLSGSYGIAGDSAFTSTGFGSFADIAAGQTSDPGTITLDTSNAGNFTDTITLDPADAGSGTPLNTETLTITGSVAPPALAQGDVHLTTFDGLTYGFQAIGDFTLAQSTVPGSDFRVQIQTQYFGNETSTSVTTGIAAQVGDNVVSFATSGAGIAVSIDGVADTALGTQQPIQLLGGGTLQDISPSTLKLIWATGETMTITNGGGYFNLSATLGPQDGPGSVQGLLGSDTGQANDIALPDGTVLQQPVSEDTLLNQFADAWTVAPGQSLLGGTLPASFASTVPNGMTFLGADAPGQILTGSLQALGAAGAPVTFTGSLADLAGDVLANFAGQDLIDVANTGSALAAASFVGSSTDGVLTIATGGGTATLHLIGSLGSGAFQTTSDQHGGTLISLVH